MTQAAGPAEVADGTLHGRRIVLGVGGSVAAYKAAHLARELLRRGAAVRVILTTAGARFVGPALFAALTGQPTATDLFAEGAPEHVALAAWAEAAVVAPATADLLGKAAAGIAEDYLTTWLLAFPGPVLFAPAMNRHMWSHPAVRRNVATLGADGFHVLPPLHGALAAAGEGEGWGRLPEPPAIADALAGLLAGDGASRRPEVPPPHPPDFAGRRLVVTAGPTRERFDPVRFLSNPSSGRMGYALAEAARDRGAEVTLVSGPVGLPAPAGVTLVRVETTREMLAAVLAAIGAADVLIGAAAPADWRPAEVSPTKVKKGAGGEQVVRLVANPDILAEVGRSKGHLVLVGFAAEAGAGPEEAQRKLRDKNLDLVAFNDVREPGAGFEAPTNRVVLLDRAGARQEVGPLPKREVAERMLDAVRRLL